MPAKKLSTSIEVSESVSSSTAFQSIKGNLNHDSIPTEVVSEHSFDDESSSESLEDTESTSSSGSSSDDDIDKTVDVSTQKKPYIDKSNVKSDIRSQILKFLPQIEKANTQLQHDGNVSKYQLDNVEEEQQRYIQMDLSLGVLYERNGNENISWEASSSENESYEPSINEDVMTKLKTEDTRKSTKRKIEEVG